VDELLTLFVVRREKRKGIEWIRDVLGNSDFEVMHVDRELFMEACRIFTEFADKEWSFTDCTSYAVMRQLGIKKAFSFDSHFKQFGTIQVLP
jgi:predicted nucleic acid-binding protein